MTIVRATPVGMGSIAPSPELLSGGYRFRGFEDWEPGHPAYADLPGTDEDEETIDPPAVIVARLHAEIAAQSPELAALVTEFEADPPPLRKRPPLEGHNSRMTAARDARLRQYAALRTSGLSKKQARGRVGISVSSADRYEADMHLVTGGGS